MWEPIAIDERAKRVWRAIDAICAELAERTSPAADLAVFWTYMASAREDAETDARHDAALERFSDELDRGYERTWLFEGLAGAGWAAAHVASGVDELLDAIDDRLVGAIDGWAGDFDLVSGIAGLGVYFLARESAAAARGRERVVEYLAAHAERGAAGATWWRPPEHLPDVDRARWPDGVYDCGVAHGVAGVIGVLERIAARVDAPAAAAPLAADATRWLLAQRGAAIVYNSNITRADTRPAPRSGSALLRPLARAAWCYGSPGTALALGGRADLADWLARAPEDTGAAGAGLCHGTGTLLHASNRMYQATRDPRFRDAALAWLDRVLADPAVTDTGDRGASILSGTAGVALALLATVSELEPDWDRTMLCDVATSSAAAESGARRAD